MTFWNPGYGIYPVEDRQISAIGGPSSPRRPKDDGHWCPYCLKRGIYEWISGYYCQLCKKHSSANDDEVKQLMIGR